MNKQRIAYVVLPFLSMVLALFICYWLNQKYAEANNIVGVDYSFVFKSFNDAVPFWAWSVYPYVSAFLFWPFAFFYIGYRSKEGLFKILLVGLVTFAIFGVWYFFFQSDVQSWRETSGLFDPARTDFTFTERFMKLIYDSAGPRNALPSTHCLMCWIAICGVRMDKKMPLPMKIFLWTFSLIIMFVTQTTKQHYIIDLIVAVMVCEIVFQIVLRTQSWMKLRDAYSTLNRRLGLDWDGITQ